LAARTGLIERDQQFGEGDELGDFAACGGTLLSGQENLGQELGEGCAFLGLMPFDTSYH
jgi:hypothetical protein